jgi:hypothetical protein
MNYHLISISNVHGIEADLIETFSTYDEACKGFRKYAKDYKNLYILEVSANYK